MQQTRAIYTYTVNREKQKWSGSSMEIPGLFVYIYQAWINNMCIEKIRHIHSIDKHDWITYV